jgi:chemotaxis protein MotB
MKYKRRKKSQQGGQSWLNTYADIITLVLVFFVLLFSMSQLDEEKFSTVTQSYRDRVIFDSESSFIPAEFPSEMGDAIDNPDGTNGPSDNEKGLAGKEEDESSGNNDGQNKGNTNDSLGQLLNDVQKFLEVEGINDVITATRTEQGVVLVLQEKVLFETGEAEIIDDGKPFLNQVGKLLLTIPNEIRVEGHTDSRPISNYRYPSNWELSGARASSVIRYLIDNFDLDNSRFQASGFGETKPVVPNDTPENMQKNRRVEIIILDDSKKEESA